MNHPTTTFNYRTQVIKFAGPAAEDSIFHYMEQHKEFYEREVLEMVASQVKTAHGGIVVDVGAFIGTHTVFFGLFLDPERVFSFEPNPVSFELLQSNIQQNGLEGRVTLRNKAIGKDRSQLSFIPDTTGNLGQSHLSRIANTKAITVDVAALDEELKDVQQPIRLMKIDVEGFESEVLDGAMGRIRKDRPAILVEAHTAGYLWRLFRRLSVLGYRIKDCMGAAPTYLFITAKRSAWRRWLGEFAWLLFASVPLTANWRLPRWYCRKLARSVS